MQYVLGGFLHKNNTSCLLLGLYHASVNWLSIVLMQIPPQNELYYGIGEKSESKGPKIMKLTSKFTERRKVYPFYKINFSALRGHVTLFASFQRAKLTQTDKILTWQSFMLLELKLHKIHYPLTFRLNTWRPLPLHTAYSRKFFTWVSCM